MTKLREKGGVINTRTVIGIAHRLIKKKDPSNEHKYVLGKGWAASLFRRMGFSKRAATTGKLEVPRSLLLEIKHSFTNEIASACHLHNIPPNMIVNFDQTPIEYVPTGKYTMAAKGSSGVSINGKGDKRNLTCVAGITMGGIFLPPQLIYKGLTKRSTPKFPCPQSFHITANATHWSNEETMSEYADHVLRPHIESQREIHGSEQKCLLIFDKFKGHLTASFKEKCKSLNAIVVHVPAGFTDHLQPLDLSVNKSLKNFINKQFNDWYEHTLSQDDSGDLATTILKSGVQLRELSCEWMVRAYHHYNLAEQTQILTNGFKAAGVSDAVREGPKDDDPFANLNSSRPNDIIP